MPRNKSILFYGIDLAHARLTSLNYPSSHKYSPRVLRSRFFSTDSLDFVKQLTSKRAKIAYIPPAMQTEALNDIADTITAQRFGRSGGAVLYPSLATIGAFAGHLPEAIGLLAYTPFCVGLHHLAIKRVCVAASDLVIRQQVFNEGKANLLLDEWIKNNDITHLSFNKNKDLVLFNHSHVSISDGLTWMDKTGLPINDRDSDAFILSINSSFFRSDKNTISNFHLNKDVRKQITYLINARSRRFREPMLSGAAAYALGYPVGMNTPGQDFVLGGIIGAVTNHHTVREDTKKLWDLIKKKTFLIEIISPEYQERYLHLDNGDSEIKLMVNSFGDIVVNPTKPLRSTASFNKPWVQDSNEDENINIRSRP